MAAPLSEEGRFPAVQDISETEYNRFVQICANAPEPTAKLKALFARLGRPRFARSFRKHSHQAPPDKGTYPRGFFVSRFENSDYCRNNIHKQHDAYQVRAFVACDGNDLNILGYYYLNLTSYRIGMIDAKADDKFGRVNAVPAVYLGMIGVHTSYLKLGIGKMLMRDAMLRTVQIAENAGTYGLTLDALDDTLVDYYAQFGFQTFRDPDKDRDGIEMCLPLKTILNAMSSGASIPV